MGLVRGRTVGLVVALAALFGLSPAASAAAEQIAYNCGDDLCVVDPDNPGEQPTDLTNTASGSERYPVWSPRGDLIAYTGYYPEPGNETWDVYTLDPAEAAPREVTNVSQTPTYNEEVEFPNWSPDGNLVAFGSRPVANPSPLGSEAYVGLANGTALPTPIGSSSANEGLPDFSPDGATVAFLRNGSSVWTAPADGTGSPAQLPIAAYGTIWSPDGRYMAGLSFGGSAQVEVTAVDGSGSHPLPAAASLNTETIDWSCDSTRLTYVADEEPLDQVRVAPADGSGPGVQIPMPTGWYVPHNPRFSPDGTKVAFDARPSSGGEIEQILVAPADGSAAATPVTKWTTEASQPTWKPGPSCAGSVPPPVSPPTPPAAQPGGAAAGSGAGTKPGSQQPVKVKLAFFNQVRVTGGFMPAASIDCHAEGGHPTGKVAEICAASAEAVATGVAPAGLRPWAKPKLSRVVFASGSVRVPEGKKKTLKLKVTAAGKKLLKSGKPIALKLTITVKHGSAKPEKKTKTVTVEPAKKK
jgi:Tol biopolymer transport system component